MSVRGQGSRATPPPARESVGWRPARLAVWFLALGGCAAAAAGLPSPSIDPGVRRSAQHGPARVIVELRLPAPFRPEGELSDAGAVARQREAIARAQQALLSRLAGTRFDLVRRFESVPLVALGVHPDALGALERMSDLVVSVKPDTLEPPAGPAGKPGS